MLLTVGFVLHYVPMLILGLQGMPRRYYNYLPQFEPGNFFAGFGAVIMVAGMVIIGVNLLIGLVRGKAVAADPWGGTTLEWSIPSPPPLHNFVSSPHIKDYPYDFSDVVKGAAHGKGSP